MVNVYEFHLWLDFKTKYTNTYTPINGWNGKLCNGQRHRSSNYQQLCVLCALCVHHSLTWYAGRHMLNTNDPLPTRTRREMAKRWFTLPVKCNETRARAVWTKMPLILLHAAYDIFPLERIDGSRSKCNQFSHHDHSNYVLKSRCTLNVAFLFTLSHSAARTVLLLSLSLFATIWCRQYSLFLKWEAKIFITGAYAIYM